MKTVNTFNGPISFSDLGHGPPLVLINGLGRTTKHWLGFDTKLIANSMRVITMDMRGVGSNPRPCGWGLTVGKMAQDVLDVLDVLSINKAHIFGISLGGMVGLEAGIKAPDRVHSLTVVNSSIGSLSTMWTRLSLKAILYITRMAIDRPNPDTAARELVNLVVGIDMPDEDRLKLAQAFAHLERQHPTSLLSVTKQILAASQYFPGPKLKNLKIPTQVVVGGHDFFVPRDNSVHLARLIPGAKLKVCNTGGHELVYDKQDILVQIVSDLINRIESRWQHLSKSI
jgi:pimeloyl-ACP methyl ester carboxylesterase